MTTNDPIRDEKLQYDINRKAAEISALSSGKIDKYECFTGEEILVSNQQEIIEQAKFTYSSLDNTYDNEDTPLISKQKEIFNELADKKIEEITNLDKQVDPDDLLYSYKGNTADAKFNQFDNAFSLLDKIRDAKIRLADAKNDQEKFKSNLNEIKKGNKKHRSKEQKNALHNNEMLYKARNIFIEFLDNYSAMVSERKLKATKETGFKIFNS